MYALSYDPIETLARFADGHGITYPLLADVGSKVIEELGILNVTMEAERAAYGRKMEARHYGLPYPGTFSLDEGGMVVERHFEQSHRVRPTTNTLLAGLDEDVAPEVSAQAAVPGVEIAAWLDTATVSANQLQRLTVGLRIDDDVHLYVPPVPDGFTALSIDVATDHPIQVRDPVMPSGHDFTVTGLPDTFSVIESEHHIEVPFYLETDRDTAGDDDATIDVNITVGFQACTAETCYLPEQVALTLRLTLVGNPEYEALNDKSVRPLMIRRLDERTYTPEELRQDVEKALQVDVLPADQVDRLLDELLSEGLVEHSNGEWAIIRPN